jgi:hypothetical protein
MGGISRGGESKLQRAAGLAGQGFGLFRYGVQKTLYNVSFDEFKTGGTLEAPSRPNAPSDEDLSKAREALAKGAAAEIDAMRKLSPDDRKRYQALAEAIGDRPVSRHALHRLLLGGKLTREVDLDRGKGLFEPGRRLMDHLDRLRGAPLAEGIDRTALLAETIAEIDDTVRISQREKNSCVPTTATILLARQKPAEFVRLVAGLAAPAGAVRMAGGKDLRRSEGWNTQNDGGRTTTSRLLQSALLNFGAALPTTYDPVSDTHRLGPISTGNGLTGGGSARINSQLQGRPFDAHLFTSIDRSFEWHRVTTALEAGKGPFPVGLQWGSGGSHEVLLETIQDNWVIFTNPSGHRQRLSVDEFRSHLRSAEIPR